MRVFNSISQFSKVFHNLPAGQATESKHSLIFHTQSCYSIFNFSSPNIHIDSLTHCNSTLISSYSPQLLYSNIPIIAHFHMFIFHV